jgi:hypothetical protein
LATVVCAQMRCDMSDECRGRIGAPFARAIKQARKNPTREQRWLLRRFEQHFHEDRKLAARAVATGTFSPEVSAIEVAELGDLDLEAPPATPTSRLVIVLHQDLGGDLLPGEIDLLSLYRDQLLEGIE